MAASFIVSGDVSQIRLVEPVPERSVSLIEDATRPQSVAMKALKKLLCADPEQF